MKNNQLRGKLGEDLASEFLKNHGYHIIFRNFRCKLGEIDIVAIKNQTLIFIEVKTRWGTPYGTPFEAITNWKLKNLIKTANYFKLLYPKTPQGMRIDAVSVSFIENNSPKIELLENISV